MRSSAVNYLSFLPVFPVPAYVNRKMATVQERERERDRERKKRERERKKERERERESEREFIFERNDRCLGTKHQTFTPVFRFTPFFRIYRRKIYSGPA